MRAFTALLVTAGLGLVACGPPPGPPETLRSYSLGSIEGVLTQDGVTFDAAQSADGNGSLRIDKAGSIRLFETGDVPAEKSRLTYSAKLRTQDLDGRAYLEMWCSYAGHGEFFSRALNAPVSGTTDWVSQQTPFILQSGQDCDNVKLNVVIEGSGTVWIDDIRLEKIAL
jgi:hypothetical protein